MKVGYARVCTNDDNIGRQRDALRAAGCEVILEDRNLAGVSQRRPGLSEAVAKLGPGDVLVVWKLDRLGLSLSHMIELLNDIGKKNAGFASLNDQIDTTGSGGRLLFQLLSALADFQRSLISERTKVGMAAARERHVHIGRPPKLSPEQIRNARKLIEENGKSKTEVAESMGVSAKTLWRALRSASS